MGHLLSVIVEGFLDFWCFVRGKQRDLADDSIVGESEFEKGGPGFIWAAISVGALLLMIVCLMVFR